MRAIFVGKCPPPPFLLWRSKYLAPQSIGPIYKSINNISNKHNCSSSMELHKTLVTKWVTLTAQRQSKWLYCIYSSFMVEKMLFCIQNDPLILRAVGNNDSMLRSKFLCYLQMPGGAGTLLIVKYPAPRTHRVSNAPGLSWVDARVWNSLVHYLYHNLLETRMYGITSANKGLLVLYHNTR